MSFESKTKSKEIHTGTFLVMRVHVINMITRHRKWDEGQTADIDIFRDKRNGLTREISFLRLKNMEKNEEISAGS